MRAESPSNLLRLVVVGGTVLLFWWIYGGIGVMQADGVELHTLPTRLDAWIPLSPA
ncbi:MAG TPA: hypothetical protein QGF58_15650 [Myxococcota bacterium]|nr:hypothetical protein [Myxococcota bacterium]